MDKKKFPITNAVDYMVALIQREREEMDRYLEQIREEDHYHKEKVAAKTRDFLEKEELMLRSLADIASDHPELLEVLQSQKPYLKKRLEDAAEGWEEYKRQ